jgi:hypothetical protein
MVKKIHLEGDFSEGYYLTGIVCSLPDFRMAYFINRQLQIQLKKYEDFSFFGGKEQAFSWYHFFDNAQRREYFLIQNKRKEEILLPDLRNFDYLLLLYGNFSTAFREELLSKLRRTPAVAAAFFQDINQVKNGDMLIELNEIHTVKQLTS